MGSLVRLVDGRWPLWSAAEHRLVCSCESYGFHAATDWGAEVRTCLNRSCRRPVNAVTPKACESASVELAWASIERTGEWIGAELRPLDQLRLF